MRDTFPSVFDLMNCLKIFPREVPWVIRLSLGAAPLGKVLFPSRLPLGKFFQTTSAAFPLFVPNNRILHLQWVNQSIYLGIRKQTNAFWSMPTSQTVFIYFKICIRYAESGNYEAFVVVQCPMLVRPSAGTDI